VVFNCPEGYYTFKHHYPEYVGELGFELIQFYDLVERLVTEGTLKLRNGDGVYTYHDPCRLGRMARIFEGPRNILKQVSNSHFVEMERNRENAVCCGTSGWANCSTGSKQIQVERLREAAATGADTLITACPKCQIHLSCALSNVDLDLKIKDLTTLIAETMEA
jgi:Fe-S oxidoreductase